MNKNTKSFLLIIFLFPLFFLIAYLYLDFNEDKRTEEEIFIDNMKLYTYNFKIDSVYRDHRNRFLLTFINKNKEQKTPVPREWEKFFIKADSIVKRKGEVKAYLYKDNQLDTILDYTSLVYKNN